MALAEGFVIWEATGDFEAAFKSAVALRRIESRGGKSALDGYLGAVARLQEGR